VTFHDGPTNICTAISLATPGGQATCTVTTLSVGAHSVVADYSGDTNYTPSTSTPVSQTVKLGTSVALTFSPNPSTYGQRLTFTATVIGSPGGPVPTGIVNFGDCGGIPLPSSGGPVSCTTFASNLGTHPVVANYSGDTNYPPSSSPPLTQTVNPAATTTTLVSSPNPSSYSMPVTLTATVSDQPAGTVSFHDGSTNLCLALTLQFGPATCTVAAFSVGSHNITADYSGDISHTPSTSSLITQTVTPGVTTTALASSHNPSTYDQAVTFTATITAGVGTPAPTGTVTFHEGTNYVCTGVPVDAAGGAACTTSALTAGSHTVVADYSSAGPYTPSSGSAGQTVNPAPLTVTAANGTMTYGASPPPITASYAGFVNGEGASVLTSAPACSTTATSTSPAGTYPSACSGAAATNYTITYLPGTITVNKASLPVIADPQSKVYGQINPTLTYHYNGFVNGDTPTNATSGAPTLTTPAAQTSGVGAYPITITQGGLTAANYTFTFTPATLTVTPAPLQVIADNQTRYYFQPNPTLTYHVTGLVNGDTPASALTGNPTLTTPATPTSDAGRYPIAITQGNLAAPNYSLTFTPGTLTIIPAPTTIAANPHAFVSATLTTFGQPLAGKTVTFTTRTTSLCSATTDARGIATCSPGLFGLLAIIINGNYTATFGGTNNYQPSTNTTATY
jgi:hypothetical protein